MIDRKCMCKGTIYLHQFYTCHCSIAEFYENKIVEGMVFFQIETKFKPSTRAILLRA